MSITHIKTLGELKQSGYVPKHIKDELRDNLINKLRKGESIFEGIEGCDDVLCDFSRRRL